jgi:hypothetical protein
MFKLTVIVAGCDKPWQHGCRVGFNRVELEKLLTSSSQSNSRRRYAPRLAPGCTLAMLPR